MLRVRLFDMILFFAALALAIGSQHLMIEKDMYLKALIIFYLFSTLYHHLRVTTKNGNASFDYGISYSLSFGIFTGPLGLLLFETIYRFTVYFYRKRTKTADPDEFFDTFYNIGSFALINSIAYYLFQFLYPSFENIPFGFWILMLLLVCVTSVLTDIFLSIVFTLLGEFKTKQDVIDFFKSRSVLDMGKTAFTNGLLLIFLQEGKWDILISLFILNYIVSRSFISKTQSAQNKMERDKFEQMAYTDFLTGVPNRAFMDKKITELSYQDSGEYIGIVVADIDNFKSINDSYNHSIGDQVIQHFASTLKHNLRDHDYLFRSGGEEFTLFLRNKKDFDCSNLVKRILTEVENSSVKVEFNSNEISVSYTASFGLYYFKINEPITIEKGYIYADHLLLQSKEQGRNRVTVKKIS